MSREEIFLKWLRRKAEFYSHRIKIPKEMVGIGDDAAVVKMNGEKILLKTDSTVSGVHFKLGECSYEQIGHKAIARPLSDIAAMGGVPCFALLSIQSPRSISMQNLQKIISGLLKTASRYKTRLVGGDFCSVENGNLSLQVSIIGKAKNPILRSTAKVGDNIFVTGKLGGSILSKHLRFEPRIKEAQILCKKLNITSMIDISDGLIRDLYNITKESSCGAVLYFYKIPISNSAKRLSEIDNKSDFSHAISDGEDYELLFTTPSDPSLVKKLNIRLYHIGKIIKERGIFLKLHTITKEVNITGYTH